MSSKEKLNTIIITGVAGFIGSNLLKKLLKDNYLIVGIDNFSTGSKDNLEYVKRSVGDFWNNFTFYEADISDYKFLESSGIIKDADAVVHLAALGSVPRSIKNPIDSNMSNINGFLNIIELSKTYKVKNFIFASSSSVYGDSEKLPKSESIIGEPLSPYALTKRVDEMYAEIFFKVYGYPSIGLRFFNVFGPLQNPDGDYAAVIPKWLKSMHKNEEIVIFGDGETTRDFCFIDNATQIISSALISNVNSYEVFNVAVGEQTSLKKVADSLRESLSNFGINYTKDYKYSDFRPGDVRSSLADISKAKSFFSYNPKIRCIDGLDILVDHYINQNS